MSLIDSMPMHAKGKETVAFKVARLLSKPVLLTKYGKRDLYWRAKKSFQENQEDCCLLLFNQDCLYTVFFENELDKETKQNTRKILYRHHGLRAYLLLQDGRYKKLKLSGTTEETFNQLKEVRKQMTKLPVQYKTAKKIVEDSGILDKTYEKDLYHHDLNFFQQHEEYCHDVFYFYGKNGTHVVSKTTDFVGVAREIDSVLKNFDVRGVFIKADGRYKEFETSEIDNMDDIFTLIEKMEPRIEFKEIEE